MQFALSKSLRDVFGENDPTWRRATIDEIFTEDSVFYDPQSDVHRGRDEIDRVAGAIKATHPDFRYQPIAEPEELGDAARGYDGCRAALVRQPAYAGTHFLIAVTGGLLSYLFFDKLS